MVLTLNIQNITEDPQRSSSEPLDGLSRRVGNISLLLKVSKNRHAQECVKIPDILELSTYFPLRKVWGARGESATRDVSPNSNLLSRLPYNGTSINFHVSFKHDEEVIEKKSCLKESISRYAFTSRTLEFPFTLWGLESSAVTCFASIPQCGLAG